MARIRNQQNAESIEVPERKVRRTDTATYRLAVDAAPRLSDFMLVAQAGVADGRDIADGQVTGFGDISPYSMHLKRSDIVVQFISQRD